MTQTDSWTIGRLLEWTDKYLKEHGSESPRLDAEVLLAHARGCERIALYTEFETVASDSLRQSFRALVKQRAEGMPVAYLVGEREFYSLNFSVTQDVLIPRPETEFVVVSALDLIKEHFAERSVEVADVGTGSGILATCIAKHAPQAKITAIDVSSAALGMAMGNARRHHVEDRMEFLESDLFDSVNPDAHFDFIVSNPPYVSEADYNALSPEVRDYEPKLALLGGVQGTEVIARLVEQSCVRLRPGGWLLFETCPLIMDACDDLVRATGAFDTPTIVKDLAQHPRVVVARKR